jgi:hypothetical protein
MAIRQKVSSGGELYEDPLSACSNNFRLASIVFLCEQPFPGRIKAALVRIEASN